IWKLSGADMCEISRNSVLQSGFENKIKKHWIGKKWYLPGVQGNDMEKTNVPNIRVSFRHETLREELDMLQRYSQLAHPSMFTNLHHDLSKRMASSTASPAIFAHGSGIGNSGTGQSLVLESPFALNPQSPPIGCGPFETSDIGLLQMHPHLPRASIETSRETSGHTNVMTVAHQLGMISVVSGVSEMAERAAAKKRERKRLAAEQKVELE
ncbi:AMP deaminase, partial [Lobosporangium transversale]